MSRPTKRQKKLFRALVTTAYEREHRKHLEELSGRFDSWRNGEMSSGELSHSIHEYERGPSKRMFAYYNRLDAEIIVLQSVARGLLSLEEIPEELREDVARRSEMLKDL